jgi:hypothetical protein
MSKKNTRKVITILTAMVFVMSLFPVAAFAAKITKDDTRTEAEKAGTIENGVETIVETIGVQIVWKDNDNKSGQRPGRVEVSLRKIDDEGNVILDADGNPADFGAKTLGPDGDYEWGVLYTNLQKGFGGVYDLVQRNLPSHYYTTHTAYDPDSRIFTIENTLKTQSKEDRPIVKKPANPVNKKPAQPLVTVEKKEVVVPLVPVSGI